MLGNVTKAVIPILLIWSLFVVAMNMKARTLVEPIFVPKELVDIGLTDVAAQRALVTKLQQVVSDARETMPGDIKDQVQADEPEPVVDVPGTGISLQSIIQYTKQSIHFGDVTIRSSLIKDKTGYKVHVYITDPSSDVDDETTPAVETPLGALSAAALVVMKKHNKFIYASALATRDRKECYKSSKCGYEETTSAFHEVLKDDAYVRYHKWSWLALSKIDEDQHNYAGEVTKSLLAVRQDRTLFWAYYNWGIGLSEQGCDKQALQAFQQALSYRPRSDFANNAAGRQALILATEADGVDRHGRKRYLDLASSYLMIATEINPTYSEAYVNLAKVFMKLGDEPDATDAFDAVLLADSPQVRRADYFENKANLTIGSGLKPRHSLLNSMVNALKDAHVDDPMCSNDQLAGSILESKGCLSPEEKQFESEAGTQLANARKARLNATGGAPDCERQSIDANVGEAAPKLLAPVY
ncbi:hypothetical protein C9I57_25200 [Trinickia symbiotica]|uniref:Uncharacterized protein n=1 Tax=Trinickia symbiotica TaxID=863227 RepID=A0A2T3XNN0_9BURK|nr:hypothetical protein C9I57_25200 [Trinickia symbiotica]